MADMQESYTNETRLIFSLDKVPADVGQAISNARVRRRWSKAALARRAKLSRWSVYRLEAGVRPQRADTLFRVAKALDIPLRDLVPEWPEWQPIAGRTIGEVARERRRSLGLTLAYVAGQVGVSDATLSRYERGLCTSPVLLQRIGDDYYPCNVRLAELLGMPAPVAEIAEKSDT